jgi:hypothetical protein
LPPHEAEAIDEPTNQDDSEKTISLSELTKPTGKTAKTTRAPRAEVSISALRDAIKASLNQDLAASNDDGDANDAPQPFAQPAPAQKTPGDEDEDDDYEKDRSHRGH